jgi:hypothetical protein
MFVYQPNGVHVFAFKMDGLVWTGDQACLSVASWSLQRAAVIGNIGHIDTNLTTTIPLVSGNTF